MQTTCSASAALAGVREQRRCGTMRQSMAGRQLPAKATASRAASAQRLAQR